MGELSGEERPRGIRQGASVVGLAVDDEPASAGGIDEPGVAQPGHEVAERRRGQADGGVERRPPQVSRRATSCSRPARDDYGRSPPTIMPNALDAGATGR